MRNVRYRVVISGRVQGVFFRDSTRREAQRLGVTGWVRNRDDGHVEAVFEGPRSAVESILAWCRSGPEVARVEGMQKHREEPTGEFSEFRVVG